MNVSEFIQFRKNNIIQVLFALQEYVNTEGLWLDVLNDTEYLNSRTPNQIRVEIRELFKIIMINTKNQLTYILDRWKEINALEELINNL